MLLKLLDVLDCRIMNAKTSFLLTILQECLFCSWKRRSLNNVRGEYKTNNLILEVVADMVINNEFVVRFEVVVNLPEIPHPRSTIS